MEDNKIVVCRLCLNITEFDDSEVLDNVVKEILQQLVSDLFLNLTDDDLKICRNCNKSMLVFYKFKNMCKRKRKIHEELKTESGETQVVIKHCDFCQNIISLGNTSDFDKHKNIVNEILKCLPQWNYVRNEKSTPCNSCFEVLQNVLSFVNTCLNTERRIVMYCESRGTNSQGKVNLYDVLQFTVDNNAILAFSRATANNTYREDGNTDHIPLIKTEDIEIKSELHEVYLTEQESFTLSPEELPNVSQSQMETRPRTRRASEMQSLYKAPDDFDDQDSESETDDVFEEQYDESDEEKSEEEQVEAVESESSESEDEQLASATGKRKRGRLRYLRGKNNFKWSLNIPDSGGRRSRPAYTATPMGRGATVKSPLEAWGVFFDEEILKIILRYTNEEINRRNVTMKTKNIQIKSHHKEVDLVELKAAIGLLYFSGLQKTNDSSVESLWSPYGMLLFRITMCANRFQFLMSCLRFDDKSTRPERKATDPFACIREIWDRFIRNCKNNYQPDSKCTIDKQLLSFRSRCRFRTYLPTRRDKSGLTVFTLNDSTTHYLYNAIPYHGTVTDKGPTESVPSYYVRKLAEPIYNTGRNITCDKWFMSVPICDKLLNEYKLTMVGTIDKNKQEIPSSFKIVNPKERTRFAYNNKKILVSLNPKRKKIVLLLSTYHDRAEIDSDTGQPEILMFHNETVGNTDSFDQKCCDFTTARKTIRCPMRYFYGMLDQANVNSFIIYNLIGSNKTMYRNDYILDLSSSLIKPFLIARLRLPTLRTLLRSQIEAFLDYKDLPETPNPRDLMAQNKMEKHKRCRYCPKYLDRKTCYKCVRCDFPMCKEHTARICVECSIQLSS